MANTMVQFRIDENSRAKGAKICEKLGIDLSTYMRMCIAKLIQERGIPFELKITDNNENRALNVLKAANLIAEKSGITDMTLEEINAEIAEVRKIKNE